MDQIDQMWRDDRLVEALSRREPVAFDDPALGPLLALTRVGEAPGPDRAVDATGVVDQARHRRYAVRSLAAAVTAVATLSTSGVAAVVTGDPLHPAKAVWEQIRSHGEIARGAEDGSALSGTSRGYAGRVDAWTSASGALASPGSDVRADRAGGALAGGPPAAEVYPPAGTATAPRRDPAAPSGRPDAGAAEPSREPAGAQPRADQDAHEDTGGTDGAGADESGAQPSQARRSDEPRDGQDSTEPTPLPEPPSAGDEPLLDDDGTTDDGTTDDDTAEGETADDGTAERETADDGTAEGETAATPLVPPDTLEQPLQTDVVATEARADG
jgi:hypothetical protein